MVQGREPRLNSVFRFVLARRFWVIGLYAVLLAAAVPFALRVQQDNSLDRLIVQDDPDFLATRAFARVFGSGEFVILFAEADDPFTPAVVATVDAIDRKLSDIPRVRSTSVFSIYRQAHPGLEPAADVAAFRAFATGTSLFERQGLVGKGSFGLPLILDVTTPADRHRALRAIDDALGTAVEHPAPLTALRKVGEPYVNDYLNRESAEGGMRLFPVFGAFVILLCLGLYRSFRTLLAFIATMGVNVGLSVGVIGLAGGSFTIVSALVPMTILVTCLATLVYIHSRFVEQPPDVPADQHQVIALSNKFLPCTASIFATAAGFAALVVSEIRPIREMGVWVAIGLFLTWLAAFTLFPALQRVLRTPTQAKRKTAAQWFRHVEDWMPRFSYRWRFVTVPATVVLCGLGAVGLFGLPGVVPPMRMLTDGIEYVNEDSALYKDTRHVQRDMPALAMADLWLKGRVGTVSQPEVLAGLDAFQRALETDDSVGSAAGVTTVLRMTRYVGGKGDDFPEDPEDLEAMADSLEALAAHQPLVSRFVDPGDLSQTHITVVTRITDYPGWQAFGERVAGLWASSLARHPALAEFGTDPPRVVGQGLLQSKVGFNLVPTLTESFVLTLIIILGAFLLVFRNVPAWLMAMIPSLFAILVMFGVMRLAGMSLNVATILIAATVLGTSENDQIHFFYHFLEAKRGGTTDAGIRHTMRIAGRSILFATLINAIGFLAFALSDLPPIRQFALLASLAFVLSMLADFTALPGALWLVYREQPEKKEAGAKAKEAGAGAGTGTGSGSGTGTGT